ncbi:MULTISPECIES: response regulator transcription factor [unclassified Brevibacterium]|uniref:response regulator transcription factor n=1 Tax=unclassified Brevibacterium TaxID=2614124 RepID=UPI001E363ABF|nr:MULTISPECIES: response regulator transcription factor [unclassified Brevibacterium]MCD1285327.1 DNA-binding response regulator [Brevibacterium sp. CCUG 69071]MDK8434375.1 response regulator transcription factor [Brevibacterium sp. H-BE7]
MIEGTNTVQTSDLGPASARSATASASSGTASASHATTSARSKPIAVLVVDDDSWTTRAITAVLRDSGEFRVIDPVHSGEDAVDAFAATRPDVVLMDVNMPPGMSGVDATEAIRTIDPEAIVVLLTTVSPGPGIARGLEAGALAVVNKTAGDDELVSVVRSAAHGDAPGLLKSLAEDLVISGDVIPDAPNSAPQLTEREMDLLGHLCRGHDYEEIAAAQSVTVHTVKSHARNLRIKLGAKSQAQVVLRAIQFKFFSPE